MSIKFTSSRRFSTAGAVATLNGGTQATASFFFRYDGLPSAAGFDQWFGSQFQTGLFLRFNGSTSSTVNLLVQWAVESGGQVAGGIVISPGIVYHVVYTFKQGEQAYFVNGVKTVFGALAGNFYRSTGQGYVMGPLGDPSGHAYSLNQFGLWKDVVVADADIVRLRDGLVLPTDLGASAYWPLATPGRNPGDPVALGDSGLADATGTPANTFAGVTGGGTAAYTDAMPFVPSAACEAVVGRTGRTVTLKFVSRVDGSVVMPGAIYTLPSAALNGTDLGPPTKVVVASAHHARVQFELPGDAVALPGDAVTLSAPTTWANTPAGLTGAMVNQACVDRVGRSAVRDDAGPRTMRVGLNCAFAQNAEWSSCSINKNLRYRATWWYHGAATDATGKPIRLVTSPDFAQIIQDTNGNLIDGTGMPTPQGLYAVGWDDTVNRDADMFSLITSGDIPNTVVSERTDLRNLGTAGVGFVRVFSFTKSTGAPNQNMAVWLRCARADLLPKFDGLVIHGPGEFAYADGVPVVLDTSDPYATSDIFKARLPTDRTFGALRWPDSTSSWGGNSSISQPEHLRMLTDWTWNGHYSAGWDVHFGQLRPWTNAGSPYIYSPLFGSPFPATLGVAVATTPPAGTRETWTISDAATAPVFAGLVLRDGGEACRVLSVSGTSVAVERGSESTTPVAHSAGPIQVSGRYPMATLADFGPPNTQVTELVSVAPHRMECGQIPMCDGGGWPAVRFSDGNGFRGGTFQGYQIPVFVTGPSTLVFLGAGPSMPGGANVTLAGVQTLDPARCYYQIRLPELSGVPYEFTAKVAAQYPDTDLRVNVPQAASDSLVDAIAVKIRDNFPPGRHVWVEYSNEPWNATGAAAQYFYSLDGILHRAQGSQQYNTHRAGQIGLRFAARFDEGGRGRGGEIRVALNLQTTAAGLDAPLLSQALSESLPVHAIMIAPYWALDGAGSITHAFNTWHPDSLADLATFDIWHNTDHEGVAAKLSSHRAAIDAWNAAHGASIALHVYELAPDLPWPRADRTLTAGIDAVTQSVPVNIAAGFDVGVYALCGAEWMVITAIVGSTLTVLRGQNGTTAASHAAGAAIRNPYHEGARDLNYSPYFYGVYQDYLALCQYYGVSECTLASFSQHYSDGNLWGEYHWLNQLPGRGDGSDGKLDNRLTLASPGRPHTKGPLENLDLKCVSPRGQAIIDWNARRAKGRRFSPRPTARLVGPR